MSPGKDLKRVELSFIVSGNAEYYDHFGKQFGGFF